MENAIPESAEIPQHKPQQGISEILSRDHYGMCNTQYCSTNHLLGIF